MPSPWQFNGTISNINGNVWSYGILVPTDIADQIVATKNTRLVADLAGLEKFHCALMSGKAGKFINVNKTIRKSVEHLDTIPVSLRLDTSEYGMPFPVELKEMLLQDPDAEVIFEGLTKGKQRTLIYQVSSPKSEDTRFKKAYVICDYLKACNGKIDFKELNLAYKNYNQSQKLG